MNAGPFYVFFGILGLMAGALIVWFVLADHPFESAEIPGGPVDEAEASLLAKMMSDEGRPMDEESIVRLLRLHGEYVEGRIRDELAAQDAARLDQERRQAEAEETRAVQEMAGRDVG